MADEATDDATKVAVFISHRHADDRPARQLQREIADLGDLRDQLASEATRVVVFVDTRALSAPNLNRFVREWDTRGRLHDPMHTGGAAPTFTAGTAAASVPTGGAAPTFTCNAPSGRSGYALLADVAAPCRPLDEPLPNDADEQDSGNAYPAVGLGTEPPRGNRLPGTFGFGIFTPIHVSGPEARPVPVASPAEAVPRIAVAIALDLLPSLRRDLLRLIGSMRGALPHAHARAGRTRPPSRRAQFHSRNGRHVPLLWTPRRARRPHPSCPPVDVSRPRGAGPHRLTNGTLPAPYRAGSARAGRYGPRHREGRPRGRMDRGVLRGGDRRQKHIRDFHPRDSCGVIAWAPELWNRRQRRGCELDGEEPTSASWRRHERLPLRWPASFPLLEPQLTTSERSPRESRASR